MSEANTLSRGQIVEAIQNVLLDYETTEQNWIDNKAKTLAAITRGVEESTEESSAHPITELKNQRLLQKKEREVQWKGILEHWEGVEEDFQDLDQNFTSLSDVLDKSRTFWKETTCKTAEDLITRNEEILEQGDKMKTIEERANKVKTTQDRMKGMMESKGEWMGRITCPLLMLFCCCYLFLTMTFGIVTRLGLVGNLTLADAANATGNLYNEMTATDTKDGTSTKCVTKCCTAESHLACVNSCDSHEGREYKTCVQDCDLGC